MSRVRRVRHRSGGDSQFSNNDPNLQQLERVLCKIGTLRNGYDDLPDQACLTNCDELVREIRVALSLPGLGDLFDSLLRDRRTTLPPRSEDTLLKTEKKLGPLFGYTANEVEQFSGQVVSGRAKRLRAISSASDLGAALVELHERAKRELQRADKLIWFKKSRAIKRVKMDLNAELYYFGVIVSDGLVQKAFGHSYALATWHPEGSQNEPQ